MASTAVLAQVWAGLRHEFAVQVCAIMMVFLSCLFIMRTIRGERGVAATPESAANKT